MTPYTPRRIHQRISVDLCEQDHLPSFLDEDFRDADIDVTVVTTFEDSTASHEIIGATVKLDHETYEIADKHYRELSELVDDILCRKF